MQINSIRNTTNFGIRFSKKAEAAIKNGLKEYEEELKLNRKFIKNNQYRCTLNELKRNQSDFFVDITPKNEILLKYPKYEVVGFAHNNKNNEKSINNSNMTEIYFAISDILGLSE